MQSRPAGKDIFSVGRLSARLTKKRVSIRIEPHGWRQVSKRLGGNRFSRVGLRDDSRDAQRSRRYRHDYGVDRQGKLMDETVCGNR